MALPARDSLLSCSLLFDTPLYPSNSLFHDWLNKMHSMVRCSHLRLPWVQYHSAVRVLLDPTTSWATVFLLRWHWVQPAKTGIIEIIYFLSCSFYGYQLYPIESSSITLQQLYCFLVRGSYLGSLTKSCKMTNDFHC